VLKLYGCFKTKKEAGASFNIVHLSEETGSSFNLSLKIEVESAGR
jgi:hypothetical protein